MQVSDLSAQLCDTLPAEQLLLLDELRRLASRVESTLRFNVEFHRFLTALSVLDKKAARVICGVVYLCSERKQSSLTGQAEAWQCAPICFPTQCVPARGHEY